MRFTQTVSLALAWFVRHLFCGHIHNRFEFLGCRDYDKIAHRAVVTIIIQTLTSVQDTYDLLLFGDIMSLENHKIPPQYAQSLCVHECFPLS